MDNFDDIIDPPNQARKIAIGLLLTGFTLAIGFSLWYYLVHSKSTDSLQHEGHFACSLLYQNPIFFVTIAFAFIVWASGKTIKVARPHPL